MTYQKHHQDCDCCGGTKAITPLETINRPGLDQIQYRIGTHPTFFETMKARLSTKFIEQPFQSITSWELTPDDMRNLPHFVRRLQKGGDPISIYLRNALKPEATTDCKKKESEADKPEEQDSEETQPNETQPDETPPEENKPEHTQQEIYCWVKTYNGTAVDKAHTDSLLYYLNEILGTELGFHAPNQISHLEISPMLRNLMNDTSKSILQINRLILDIAYPDLVIPKLRLYPLNDLTTRQVNDPAIALLDAWSTVADVLTFYQERFANEGYLPTATERRSILELANLVGYKLRPGVSASTFLAFDVEKGHELIIPQGTRAQSIPGPGELPQAFETSQDFYAKDVWSNMKPRTTSPQIINETTSTVYLSGIHTHLKPNMPIMVFPIPLPNEAPIFRRIKDIIIDSERQETIATLSGDLELSKLRALVNKLVQLERIRPISIKDRGPVSPNEGDGLISLSWKSISDDEYSGSVFYDVKIRKVGSKDDIVGEFHSLEIPSETDFTFKTVSSEVNESENYYLEVHTVDHLSRAISTGFPKGKGQGSEPAFASVKGKSVIDSDGKFTDLNPEFDWESFLTDDANFIAYENYPMEGGNYNWNGDQKHRLFLELSQLSGGSYEPVENYPLPINIDNSKHSFSFTTTQEFRCRIRFKEKTGDSAAEGALYTGNRNFTAVSTQVSSSPEFIIPQNDNASLYLYITRNLKPVGGKIEWDYTDETALPSLDEGNPLNTGALLEIKIPHSTFQSPLPILDSVGKYYWHLSEEPMTILPNFEISVAEIRNGDWLVIDILAESKPNLESNQGTLENLKPSKNALLVPIPGNTEPLIFSWDAKSSTNYSLEVQEFRTIRDGQGNLSSKFEPIESDKVSKIVEGGERKIDYPFKQGTRYRWRIKYHPNESPVVNGAWLEFTTNGSNEEDQVRERIYQTILGRLHKRILSEPKNSYFSGMDVGSVNEDVEPLLSILENDQSTIDQLQLLIELQKPGLLRDRDILHSLFAPETAPEMENIQPLQYPQTSFALSEGVQWVRDLEITLSGVERQLDLIPIRSQIDELPFSKSQLKISNNDLEQLQEFISNQPANEIWVKIGDVDREKLKNGDKRIGDLKAVVNQQPPTHYGLVNLKTSLESALNNENLAIQDEIEIIVQIEGQIRRIADIKVAVFFLECATLDDCSLDEIKVTEKTTFSSWLDKLQKLLRTFTKPPDEEDDETSGDENRKLLAQLTKPPSVQNLDRSFANITDTNSNFATQLLTTFVPELKGLYYQALSAQTLSPELEQQNLYLFNIKATLFAANSPDTTVEYKDDDGDKTITFSPNPIAEIVALLKDNQILLDGEYREILKKEDSWIILEQRQPGDGEIRRIAYKVKQVYTESKPGFGKITGLIIENPLETEDEPTSWKRDFITNLSYSLTKDEQTSLDTIFSDGVVNQAEARQLQNITSKTIDTEMYRNIVVYAQNEALPLSRKPDDTPISGKVLELDALYDGFYSGRPIVISGERVDIPNTSGIFATELGIIKSVQEFQETYTIDDRSIIIDRPITHLILANDLAYSYVRDSVTIQANVIEATHGETRTEVLGNGDATQATQTFMLKQKPLTHVAAPTSSGVDSELTVYVNDVAWDETENLVFLDKEERGMMTKIDNEDKVLVIFGDGLRGARLPTGVENVRAVYRSGIGKAGNVAAEKISMLATKPLGVKGVINSLAATGGVDRETLGQARKNAPIPLFALDRLVSLKDYEDFTRAFAGVAKAKVAQIDFGDRALIHLTVALVDDVPFDTTSALYNNMVASLNRFGTLNMPLQVDKRSLSLMIASINISIEVGYIWKKVETAVRQRILHHFGFDNWEIGQDVFKSEIVSVIQGVTGVAYVDIDLLATISETGDVNGSLPLGSENESDEVRKLQKAIQALEGCPDQIEIKALPTQVEDAEGFVIKPAEIAYFSPDIPDALILKEVRP